jgi:chemotaxis methyl-accepting protein methylase
VQKIIDYIKFSNGKDLSVYSESFLYKTIEQRIEETLTKDITGYLSLIETSSKEIEILVNTLNISYSLFFRNTIDFCIIERYILPDFIQQTSKNGKSLRIWSAACADGAEPYSFAMIANELIQKQSNESTVLIHATDISETALGKAKRGVYFANSVQNVRYSFINDYFNKKGQQFEIKDQIKQMVEFTAYDLLDKKTTSPPTGIFGGYDIIICCNLLIYYKPYAQKTILEKLYKSLDKGGVLLVDESEKSIIKMSSGFRLYSQFGNIFVKTH